MILHRFARDAIAVFLAMMAVPFLSPRAAQSAEDAAAVDFHRQVLPILVQRCAKCHTGEDAEGGLRMDSRQHFVNGGDSGPAVVVGDSAKSLLIERVTESDAELRMPQEGQPLSAAHVAVLRRWIDSGLAWDEEVNLARQTYEPPLHPRRPQLPTPSDGRENPVDRILDQYLAHHNINRPGPIDDARFMRRVYLDLIGLLPAPDELALFLDDRSDDKRARLVQHVLDQDDAYATHWLTFWNDLLRNTYSGTGFIDGGRKQITGWLYRSLRENKPYDQFVRELIDASPESEGFIRGIKWRGNVNASQTREIQFSQNVTQVLLGINMKCASCHDSFIDRWTLRETYNFAAVVATSPLQVHRCDKPQGTLATPAWIFPELGGIDARAPRPARLEQLAALMVHPQNGRLTRTIVNRLWHRMMGRGIVHPVDAMHTRPFSEDVLDFLAVYLVDRQYDLKEVLRLIATSQAYQSQSVVLPEEPSVESYVYSGPVAKRMTAEQFLDAMWSMTDTSPLPDKNAFRLDGRGQGGQLAAVLEACGESLEGGDERARLEAARQHWGGRPIRAALTPLDPLQSALGRPHRDQVVTSRPSELTTLEAITLTNGPMLAELLRRGALRTLEGHQGTPQQLVDWLFLAAVSRPPTAAEAELARKLLGDDLTVDNVEDLIWTVVMLPEFQLIR